MIVLLFLFVMAIAFSAIGHGGASGYTAVLVLFNYTPNSIRPIVLMMNIIVTTWILLSNRNKNQINHKIFLPLISTSIPFAYLGGVMPLHDTIFRYAIAGILAFSAARLIINKPFKQQANIKRYWIFLVGACLGWLAGLTGIGGGVLLSPLLIFTGWANLKASIPIVAAFILVNSIAGLVGFIQSEQLSEAIPMVIQVQMLIIALIGAILGSYWAKKTKNSRVLEYLLAVVLAIASIKMFFTA